MNQGPSDSNSFIAQQKVEEEQTSTTTNNNNSKLLLQQHQVLLERHQQGSSSSSSAPTGNKNSSIALHQGKGTTTNSNTTAAAAFSTGAVAAAGLATTYTDSTTALRQKNDLLMMEKARSVIDTVLALNQLSPADNNNAADNTNTQTRTHTENSSNIMIRNDNESEQTNVAAPTQTNTHTVGAGTSSTNTRRRSSPPSNQLLQAADQHGATTADITSSSSGAAAIGGGPNKKLYWFTEDPSPEDFNGMTFPQKLHHVLRNDKHASVISWLPSGRSFVVRDQKKFASDIVPKYFGKHIAYTSFTRRLARWGWQNIAKGTYFNKDFNRDNPEQCLMMQYNSSTVSNRPTGGAGGNTMTNQGGGGGGGNMHQATCGTMAGYPSSNQNMMTMGAVVGTGGNEKRSANEMLATSSSAYGPGSSAMMGTGTMGHPHHPMVPSPKRQNSGNLTSGGGGLSSGAGAGPTSNVVPPYHTNPAAFLASFGVTATAAVGDGVNSVHQLQMPSALHSSFTHHMPTAPAGSTMTSSIGQNLPSTTSGTGAGILFPPPSELLSGVNGGVTGQTGNFNDVVGAGGRSCSSLPDITLMEQHQGLVGGGANHPLSQSGTAMPSSLMSFGVPRGGGGNGFDPLFGVVGSGAVGTSELLSSRATDGSNSTNSRNNGTFTPSEMLQSSTGGGGETTAAEQQDSGAAGAGLISSPAAGAVDDSNASTSSNQALHHHSKNTINDSSGAPGPPPHHHPGTTSNSNLLDLPPSQSNADPAPSSAAAGLEHPGAPSSLFSSQYPSAAAAAALPYGGMGAMDFTKFHNYMMMDSNSSAGAGTGAGANAAATAAAHHEFAQKQMEIDQLQQRLFAYEQLQQHQKNLFANTGAAPAAAANFMGDSFLSSTTSSNYPYGNSSGTAAGMIQQQQSILNASRQQGHLLDDITGLGNMGLHSFTGEQQGQQQEENSNGGTRHVFFHNAAA